jgi:acetyl esterase
MKTALCILSILAGVAFPGQQGFSTWWRDSTPWEVRDSINRDIMAIEAPEAAVWSVTQTVIHNEERSTPVRIYAPSDHRNLPVLLLIHGGAWVAGNLDTHDLLARYLCSETDAVVVSVEYQNAPEGKFPIPVEQCYDALIWTTEHADELAVDLTRVAVIGDSAGGNMSASLSLMARDRQGPKIAMQVLINPAPDLSCDASTEWPGDIRDALQWIGLHYFFTPEDVFHPYASPQLAQDLSGLPDAVVLLAETDKLLASGQKYADALQAAGVPTFVYCQKGIGHLAGQGARASLAARESLDVAVRELRKIFYPTRNL